MYKDLLIATPPAASPPSLRQGAKRTLTETLRVSDESFLFIYNNSGLLSLDGRGFFPPIRTGKTTVIVDGRLNVCGEGELTFVEMTVGHNLRT